MMAAISQMLSLLLISISLFGEAATSPLFSEEQEKLLEALLEGTNEEDTHGKEMFSGGNDEWISKYAFNAVRESNGKEQLGNSPKKQVGDRRLKCILYDTKSKKCLRHKMSFIWGRR